MTAPLDLRAVEETLRRHENEYESGEPAAVGLALLAHCRALRAALDNTRQGRCWCIFQGTAGRHSDHCESLTTVLAAARDGPA